MKSILLVLRFAKKMDAVLYARKEVDFQSTPRAGELIIMDDVALKVSKVRHHFRKTGTPYVSVECCCGMEAFIGVMRYCWSVPGDDGGWEIECSNKALEESVRDCLKR